MMRKIAGDDELWYAVPPPKFLLIRTASGERYLAKLLPLDNSPREHVLYLSADFALVPVPAVIAAAYRSARFRQV
jgi:hypothetical protein